MISALSDRDLLTLCVFEEAAGEIPEGRAAVARVVLNRTRRKYESDGTIQDTILRPNQFSWTTWSMVGGRYVRVALNTAAELARVAALHAADEHHAATWAACADIASQVASGAYHGPLYGRLTDDTVLYLNRAISHAPWATADKLVCQIGHHSFYRA